jgi:hypothetical protein
VEVTRQRLDRLERTARITVTAIVVVGLAITVALFTQTYNGRKDIVDSQRRACQTIAKPRDALNARGWRNAEHRSRIQGFPHYADSYAKIARFLEGPKGAHADCAARYPYPSFWPWNSE